MKLAGHCHRHKIAHHLVFWEPKKGRPGRGRPTVNYIDNLKADTGLTEIAEIKNLIEDQKLWKNLSSLGRAKAGLR